MVTPMHAAAERLADEVKRLIRNPEAELSVLVETGPDEAMIVGTPDAFLRLAEVALRIASESPSIPVDPINLWDGIPVRQRQILMLFDVLAEIRPDVALVVANEEDRKRLRDWMWEHSPPHRPDPP